MKLTQTKTLNASILILSIAASFIVGLDINLAKRNNKPSFDPSALRAYQIDFKLDTTYPYKGAKDSLLIYDRDRYVGAVFFSNRNDIQIDSLLTSDNQ